MLIIILVSLCVLLFFFQLLILRRVWKKGVDISLSFSPSVAERGDTVEVVERSRNLKRIPLPAFSLEWRLSRLYGPYMCGDLPFASSSTFAFPGRTEVIRRKKLDGLKRGIYTFSDGKISSSDLFFTKRETSPIYNEAKLVVLPGKKRDFLLSFPCSDFLGSVLSKKRSEEDPFEMRAIRPYVPTDPMRSINWKATARTGELRVNQYEWTTDESVAVIADFDSCSEEEGEELIEYISSFAYFMLSRGIALSLDTNARSAVAGGKIRVGKGSDLSHSRSIDFALSEIKLSSGAKESLQALLSSVFSSPLHGVPVLFTSSLKEDDKNEFIRHSSGYGFVFALKGEENRGQRIYILGGEDE